MTLATERKRWQFPDDVIVDRAMLDVLVQYLAERNLIDSNELVERFKQRLDQYLEKDEPVAQASG